MTSVSMLVHRTRGRQGRKTCVACGQHQALFARRHVVKWDRHHTLCFRCFRSQTDSIRRVV
jgi:hypothetical protein